MKKYLFIIIILAFTSCKSIPYFDYSKLTKTDTIYKLDLSNRNLKEQPNLSDFTIIELNLSNNKLTLVQMPLYEEIKADTLNVADNKYLETKSWAFPVFYKTLINYSISTKN